MYLPTDQVLYEMSYALATTQDYADRIDWIMYARWDIDHIIADLDKLWPSND